jgi:hypothetical protein
VALREAAWVLAELTTSHFITLHERKYGATTHYWSGCRCGYESKPGRSREFAANAGVGHLNRQRERLKKEFRERTAGKRPDFPQGVSGRS